MFRVIFFSLSLLFISYSSLAFEFESIPIEEFETKISELGKEASKEFEISKKVVLTSGKISRGEFWSVGGVAMGSSRIFQAGKIGFLKVNLIVNQTKRGYKSIYKLHRPNKFKSWQYKAE